MKLAAIYARQSKDKRDSVSIDAQVEKCIALCHFKGKEYKVYIDKGYSGKNTDRPDYSEVIDDIKAGVIDEVVVYKVDRISRNLNDFTSMVADSDKFGVSFASATESFDTASPMGRAMMYLLMVFAQLERETIAERIKDNAMYRASLGRWTGGPVPFGYNNIKTIDGGKSKSALIINEDEASTIKQLFEWYLEPSASVRSVVYKANMLGIKTKDGVEWSNTAISRILQNVLYASNTPAVYYYFSSNDETGITLYNEKDEFDGLHAMMYYRKRGEEVKKRKGLKTQEQYVIIGEHQGIIFGDTWVKVQEKLQANKLKAPRTMTGKLTFLSGLVKCEICGSPMLTSWTGQPIKHMYMKCRRREMKGKFLCANKAIRVDTLEDIVANKMISVCSDKDFLESLILQAKDIEENSLSPLLSQSETIQRNIEEKEKEIKNLINSLKSLTNEFVTKQVEKEIERLTQDIESFKTEIRKLNDKIEFSKSQCVNKQFLIDNYHKFPKAFEKASLEEKQILLRGLIRDITVDKGNVTINFF